MRVLITGGAGFIGSNLATKLVHEGIYVRIFDDLSNGTRENLENLDVEIVERSLLDVESLSGASRDMDSIVHLAALGSVPRSIEDPQGTFQANVLGTLNVLEVARQNECYLVGSSSSAVYGQGKQLLRCESDAMLPVSPYGASKVGMEAYMSAYSKSYNLESLVFRFFNVYGPGQLIDHPYSAVIPRFISSIIRSEPILLHGDGSQSRDFTYVDTVTEVLTSAITRRVISETPVNLSSGSHASLNEVLGHLEEISRTKLTVVKKDWRKGDIRSSSGDPKLLKSLFPSVDHVSVFEGLCNTFRWYVERLRLGS